MDEKLISDDDSATCMEQTTTSPPEAAHAPGGEEFSETQQLPATGKGEGDVNTLKRKAKGSVAGEVRRKSAKRNREKLKREPSLDDVDEYDEERQQEGDDEEEEDDGEEHPTKAGDPENMYTCPDFGVKSYLHHFYDSGYKDPSLYEDEDDFRYLLHPNPRRRRCTSIWWKVFVWIGANLLVFGIIGILVGYLVPQKPLIVDKGEQYQVLDKDAPYFNYNLDVCKLVGLVIFCVGGLTLAVSLIFPSFLHHYCDDGPQDAPFKVSLLEDEPPPSHPLDMSIPATTKVSNVQPNRRDKAQDATLVNVTND